MPLFFTVSLLKQNCRKKGTLIVKATQEPCYYGNLNKNPGPREARPFLGHAAAKLWYNEGLADIEVFPAPLAIAAGFFLVKELNKSYPDRDLHNRVSSLW